MRPLAADLFKSQPRPTTPTRTHTAQLLPSAGGLRSAAELDFGMEASPNPFSDTEIALPAKSQPRSTRPAQVPRLDLTSIHRNAGCVGGMDDLNSKRWKQPYRPLDDVAGSRVLQHCSFAKASSEDQQRIAEFYGYRDEGFVSTMQGLRTDEIRNGLYLGNMADAAYWPLLKELRITHILNCAVEAQKTKPPYESHGIKYTLVPLHDSVEQTQVLTRHRFKVVREATRDLHAARRASPSNAVLVHCVQGASRSAAMVCAYLMEYEGLSMDRALHEVRTRHQGCLTAHHWQSFLYKFNAELLRGC